MIVRGLCPGLVDDGCIDMILTPDSPNKILRSFPPLDAKEIIALTVLIVRKIPDALYAELLEHAK